MTQDELDALMAGEVDLEALEKDVKKMEEQEDKKDGHSHKHYDDNHLVAQLGDVTAESELKATQIFDKLDAVLVKMDELEKAPHTIDTAVNDIKNEIFEIMSIMQYQDIHRQKIERVINTMRSISQLMSHTLDTVSFAPSAKHIAGDSDTSDLVDDTELEALIAQMANK